MTNIATATSGGSSASTGSGIASITSGETSSTISGRPRRATSSSTGSRGVKIAGQPVGGQLQHVAVRRVEHRERLVERTFERGDRPLRFGTHQPRRGRCRPADGELSAAALGAADCILIDGGHVGTLSTHCVGDKTPVAAPAHCAGCDGKNRYSGLSANIRRGLGSRGLPADSPLPIAAVGVERLNGWTDCAGSADRLPTASGRRCEHVDQAHRRTRMRNRRLSSSSPGCSRCL